MLTNIEYPTILPDELQHGCVDYARNRCDPKRECYHVILNTDETPNRYRQQWNDDWEMIGGTIEYDGIWPFHDAVLRLTLLERRPGEFSDDDEEMNPYQIK